MFDLSLPIQPAARAAARAAVSRDAASDHSWSFALTMPDRSPGAVMSGQARPLVLDRFAALAEAMNGAAALVGHLDPVTAPQLLAILDREARLVLAGAAAEGAIAWCPPVASAPEARTVVAEASQLRAQASRAADWKEPDLSRRLRHRAELLEARLVDPLWRAFSARALQRAA